MLMGAAPQTPCKRDIIPLETLFAYCMRKAVMRSEFVQCGAVLTSSARPTHPRKFPAINARGIFSQWAAVNPRLSGGGHAEGFRPSDSPPKGNAFWKPSCYCNGIKTTHYIKVGIKPFSKILRGAELNPSLTVAKPGRVY